MKAICPECKESFQVPKQMAGRSVKCPNCREQIEIAKLPTPPLVKLLLNIAPPLISALVVGLICWGYFTLQNQKTLPEKIAQAEAFAENKFKADREKDKKLIQSLQTQIDSAIEASMLTEAKVDHLEKELKDADAEMYQLSKELDDAQEQVAQKENDFNTMANSLKDLDETISSQTQQKDVQKKNNLRQAMEKGADVWSLSGIRKLQPVVLISPEQENPQDIEPDEIKNQIKAVLEENQIDILEDRNAVNVVETPRLLVRILFRKAKQQDETFDVNVALEVKQNVTLLRDDTIISVGVTTWEKEQWETLKANTGSEHIQAAVSNLLDMFIFDHQIANAD
jgi:hypothetical protein